MRDALTASAFGITLEEFAHLEEEHYKHCLGELCLGSWQKAYAQGSYRSHRHKEVLVEHVALGYSFQCLAKSVMTYQQIRHKIHKQQLPCGKTCIVLYYHCCYKQKNCCCYQQQLSPQSSIAMLMMVMMFVLMMMAMAMTMLMSIATFTFAHNLNIFVVHY